MLIRKHIFLLLFLFLGGSAMSQDESSKVYETVMSYYGEKFNVIKSSSKRTLNQAYFKDPLRMELSVRDTLNDDWMIFLKGIDTSKVMTGPINTAFVKNIPILLEGTLAT